MSNTSKAGGVADLLSGEAADAERARVGAVSPAGDERELDAAAKPAAVASRSRKATRRPKAAAKKPVAKKTAARPARKKTESARAGATRLAGNERARDVALQILKRRGGEMAVQELAAAVVKSGRTKLAGKTPAATVGAQIYVSAKKGELFKVVRRGVVAVLEAKS